MIKKHHVIYKNIKQSAGPSINQFHIYIFSEQALPVSHEKKLI